jgi:hypothetical protein
MSEQQSLAVEYLERIADATELAARRLFWIALPIYLALGVFVLYVLGFVALIVAVAIRG